MSHKNILSLAFVWLQISSSIFWIVVDAKWSSSGGSSGDSSGGSSSPTYRPYYGSSGGPGSGGSGPDSRGVTGYDPKNSTHHFQWVRIQKAETMEVSVNMINSTTADGTVTSNLTDPIHAYDVTTKRNPWGNYYSFKLRIYPANGGRFDVWVDGPTKKVWCGLKQTYTSSDGVHYAIDPRGGLKDRWYIRKSSDPRAKYNMTQDYTFFRKYHSLSGDIKDEKDRTVAHFHEHPLSKPKHRYRYTISSTGEVPDDVLVGLYWTVILRLEICTI